MTVLLLILRNNVNISRLNRIGRQLQPVELAAGELAVNWQTTSAWFSRFCPRRCGCSELVSTSSVTTQNNSSYRDYFA